MSDLLRASQRAARIYRSKNFRKAYVNGARAALAGRAESTCPYRLDPNKTWRLAYRKAWLRGFQSIPRRVD